MQPISFAFLQNEEEDMESTKKSSSSSGGTLSKGSRKRKRELAFDGKKRRRVAEDSDEVYDPLYMRYVRQHVKLSHANNQQPCNVLYRILVANERQNGTEKNQRRQLDLVLGIQ